MYGYYDSQLNAALQIVDSLVDQINETSEDSLSVYLTYAALLLSVSNSVAMIIACKSIYRVVSTEHHKCHCQLLRLN